MNTRAPVHGESAELWMELTDTIVASSIIPVLLPTGKLRELRLLFLLQHPN